MKKFTKVLMLCVMALSVFGYTACNDVNQFGVQDVKNQNDELRDQLAKLQAKVDALNSCTCDIEQYLKDHGNTMTNDEIINLIANTADTLASKRMLNEAVQELLDAIKTDSTNLAAAIEAEAKDRAAGDSTINVRIDGIDEQLVTIVQNITYVTNLAKADSMRINSLDSLLTIVVNNYEVLRGDVDSIKTDLTGVHFSLDGLRHDVDSIFGMLDDLATKAEVADLYARTDSLHQAAMDALVNYQTITDSTILSLTERLNDLEPQVAANTQAISELKREVNSILDALSKTIYSMVVQGTVNPVFGSFALPVGVQSNVLMCYYGDGPDHAVVFPSIMGDNSDLVNDTYALTQQDVQMLNNPATITLGAQQKIISHAGKLYLTINPNSADLSTTNFVLVNSQAQESGIKLDSIVPSNDILTWGYNRAPAMGQSPVGFYEATASLTEENIDAVKIKLDVEELKNVVKDIVRNHDKQSINSLATALYHQVMLNNDHPRNGVQATWADSLGAHSVMSDMSVMATAVKPLSYAFDHPRLHGLGDKIDRRMPHITPIHELDVDAIIRKVNKKVNLKPSFKVSFNLTYPDFSLKFDSVHFSSSGHLYVNNVVYDNNGVIVWGGQVPVEGGENFVKALQDSLNYEVGIWSQEATDLVKNEVDKLIDEVNEEVAKMMTEINAQANTQIQDVLRTVLEMTVNRANPNVKAANRFINLYNKVYNKMISLLNDPNALLQVTMFYKGNDGNLHHMSTNAAVPSVFVGTGAYTLVTTSYTVDVVAPAYAKFVAVTNVWNANGSAQEGNAACVSALRAANNGQYLNTVLEGGRYGIAASLQAGYTYEIFYSAVDYSGMISQRKYYVTVK